MTQTSSNCTISVVIPVHNGTSMLEQCLAQVVRSHFPDYECIVVDDASTEPTLAVARQYGATTLRLDTCMGPAYARNRGAELARGELLFFIDADVCIYPDTLDKIVAYFRAHPSVDALIGSYDDAPHDPRFISQYKNLLHHYIHQHGNELASTFWSGCGAIKRQVFFQFGGYNEAYHRPSIEDIELGFRLKAAQCPIYLVKDLQVKHLKHWSLWGLLRTDVRDRGIPWVLLMLRDKTFPVDLNVRLSHRLSVVLLYVLVMLLGYLVFRPFLLPGVPIQPLLYGVALLLLLLLLLNYELYFFFARKRSVLFALLVLPLHWLYYFYSGLSVIVGLTMHLWSSHRTPVRRV